MTAPVYTEYLLKQVTGALASPAAGFTLWNNSNNYYMVKNSLTEYLPRPPRETPPVTPPPLVEATTESGR